MPQDFAVHASPVWSCAKVMIACAGIPIVLPLIPLFIIITLSIAPLVVPLVIGAHVLGFTKGQSGPQQKRSEDKDASKDPGDQHYSTKSGQVHGRDVDVGAVEAVEESISPKRPRQDVELLANSLIEETLREARLEVSQESDFQSPKSHKVAKKSKPEEEPSGETNPYNVLWETPGDKSEEKLRNKAEEFMDRALKKMFTFNKDKSSAQSDSKVASKK